MVSKKARTRDAFDAATAVVGEYLRFGIAPNAEALEVNRDTVRTDRKSFPAAGSEVAREYDARPEDLTAS
jgi:hypothetical protein